MARLFGADTARDDDEWTIQTLVQRQKQKQKRPAIESEWCKIEAADGGRAAGATPAERA